jgi:hypothetical protein
MEFGSENLTSGQRVRDGLIKKCALDRPRRGNFMARWYTTRLHQSHGKLSALWREGTRRSDPDAGGIDISLSLLLEAVFQEAASGPCDEFRPGDPERNARVRKWHLTLAARQFH